jgi:hypothetical protein
VLRLLLLLPLTACGVLADGNHPTLDRLDAALPEPEAIVSSVALDVLVLPMTIPAGLMDTFIAHPALRAPGAWEEADEVVWQDPSGSTFYQAAIFIPKLAVTPIVFAGAWTLGILWGEDI